MIIDIAAIRVEKVMGFIIVAHLFLCGNVFDYRLIYWQIMLLTCTSNVIRLE